jgi:hypothetical protein
VQRLDNAKQRRIRQLDVQENHRSILAGGLVATEPNFGPRNAKVVATLRLLARAQAALCGSGQAQTLLQRVYTLTVPAAR